jgi:hypothetical protein
MKNVQQFISVDSTAGVVLCERVLLLLEDLTYFFKTVNREEKDR